MQPKLKGRSILIVEDQPLIAFDIAQAFERTGALMTTTATVEHALIIARHDNVAGAILDNVLPDGDCSTLCEVLSDRGIPFIIHSGLPSGMNACKDAPHVPKPADPELLVSTLQEMILGGSAEGNRQ